MKISDLGYLKYALIPSNKKAIKKLPENTAMAIPGIESHGENDNDEYPK